MVADLLIRHAREDGSRWRPIWPASGRYEIWLGGLLWSHPVLAGGTTLTENFNRADGAGLGSLQLTWSVTAGAFQVIENHVLPSAGATDSRARVQQDLASSNNAADLLVTVWEPATSDTSTFMAGCRWATSADTAYFGGYRRTSTTATREVLKIVAGSATSLLSESAALVTGARAGVQAMGSTIGLLRDGSVVASVTDSSLTTGRRAGIFLRQYTEWKVMGDDFVMADLTPPGPAAPDSGRRLYGGRPALVMLAPGEAEPVGLDLIILGRARQDERGN